LPSLDKGFISRLSSELGFVRDTFEKVYRLVDILEYLSKNTSLNNSLALKGGTAINLTLFDMPRLSVDIDIDFSESVGTEEMLRRRELINRDIHKHMETTGYTLSPRSKDSHSLVSLIFDYTNTGTNKDNIKIEINYSMRHHVMKLREAEITIAPFEGRRIIRTLAVVEIFAGKINALISRAAARDLYDVHNIIRFNIFNEDDLTTLRKCVLFYFALSSRNTQSPPRTSDLERLTPRRIRTDLLPILRKNESFNLEEARDKVKSFLSTLLVFTDNERRFIELFNNRQYKPDLLFDDSEILGRIADHPMALWRTRTAL